MRQSKLFGLVRLFSDSDLKRAEVFLTSPYFNSSEVLIKLFRYIKKYVHQPDHPKFTKEQAYRYLYGDVPFNAGNLRTLSSRLNSLLCEFLAVEELKGDQATSSRLLITSLSQRKAYPAFTREIEQRVKSLKRQATRGTAFYLELLWLNQAFFFHPDTPRTSKGGESLSEIMNCTDLFFVLSKLQLANELFIRETILPEKRQVHLLPQIIELGETKLAEQNKLIKLYTGVIHLQKNGLEKQQLQNCIDDFLNHRALMEKSDQTQFLHNLINLTLTALNAGQNEFLPDVVNLYKVAVSHNLMLDRDRIAYTTFVNVAILGAAAKEFSWTREFIAQFTGHIDPKYQGYATKMAWAFWYYQRGLHNNTPDDYEQAIHHLSQVSYISVPIDLRIRSLLLRIYYDYHWVQKDDVNLLLDHLDAFEKYIMRNATISSARAEGYHNLIKTTRHLVRLKSNKKQPITPKVEALQQEIEQSDKLVLRVWLSEKVKELR